MTYSRKTFLICIYLHLKLVPQATTSVTCPIHTEIEGELVAQLRQVYKVVKRD